MIHLRVMMNLKHKRKREPNYANGVAHSREALTNPETGEVVHKKRYYQIIKTRCYDDPNDKSDTWANRTRYSKNALTATQEQERHTWSLGMLAKTLNAYWWRTFVIWTDICNTLLPSSQRRHEQLVLSKKRRKGWGSKNTPLDSDNLAGKPEGKKQKGFDAVRVYWAPILSNGKVHLAVLDEDFPGETADGAAMLVAEVRYAA